MNQQSETNPASTPKRRPLRRLLLIAGGSYLAVAALVTVFQRSLLYVPFRATEITAADAGALAPRTTSISVEAEDGVTLHGWRVSPVGERRRTVLCCPGNAANRKRRVSTLEILSEDGTEVFLFDYRGYGDNEGSPSEEAIAADMRRIWDWLTKEQKIRPNEIVVYGQSLGGGVAVRLVSDLANYDVQPAGLLLVATFSSMVDAAKNRFGWLPVDWLLLDRYPSEDCIGKVSCPVMHIHGDIDRIVPIGLGRKLFEHVPETSKHGIKRQFIELPGAGHNNILQVIRGRYREAVLLFLERACPLPVPGRLAG